MEDEALVPVEPGADLGVLVGGVVVEEDAPDRAGADAARPCHQIGGPMGGLDRRIGKRQRHHTRGHLRTERRDARGPRLAMPSFMNRSCQRQTQVFDLPVRRISLVPTPSALERMIAARPSVFLRGVTVPGDRFKSAADGPRDRDRNSGAHAPASHGNRNTGIPIRTLLSGKDH